MIRRFGRSWKFEGIRAAATLVALFAFFSASAGTHEQTEAQREGRRTQEQQTRGNSSKSHTTAEQAAKELNDKLGTCSCKLDPDSREADEKPIGKIEVHDLHGEPLKVSVVNEELALELFQKMTSQAKIPFGFPEDGCFARAHEMSYQLAKKHIETGKIFATGVFRMSNEKAENGRVTWGFHVAPTIAVARGSTRELWVIDPSMFYEPVPVLTWLKKLTSQPGSYLTSAYLTTKFVYHPMSRDKKLTDFDPKDLRAAKLMMKRYLKAEVRREHVPAEEDSLEP